MKEYIVVIIDKIDFALDMFDYEGRPYPQDEFWSKEGYANYIKDGRVYIWK